MEFLAVADAHVKARTWTNSTLLAGDAYAALDIVGKEAERLSSVNYEGGASRTLVSCGDWFDSNRPSSEDVIRSFRAVDRFASFLYISGNHDPVDPPFWEAFRPDVLNGQRVRRLSSAPRVLDPFNGAYIAGVDWKATPGAVLSGLSAIAEAARGAEGLRRLFVCMHGSFRHLLGFDGAWQFDADDVAGLFAGIDTTVLVGDIHTRGTLDVSGTFRVHSPGSLYPLSWDKVSEPCFASRVDTCTGLIEDVPVRVREYRSLRAADFQGMDALEAELTGFAELGDGLPLPTFVRVDVTGADWFDRQRAAGCGVVVQAVQDDVEVDLPELPLPEVCPSLEAAVSGECGDDGDARDMALALMRADDPVAEMDGWMRLWGVETIN